LLTMLLHFGSIATPQVLLLVCGLAAVCAPCAYFVWYTINVHVLSISMLMLAFINILLATTLERGSRQTFLSYRVADFYVRERERAVAEQTALLERIVPVHVVPELMAWMQQELAPEESIVQVVPAAAIAFVRMFAPPEVPNMNGEAQDATHSWLVGAHEKVDDTLRPFTAFLKIKTIGDCFLLAGPFGEAAARSDVGVARAAMELLEAITLLKGQGMELQAGLHVGDAVAAVLGTSKLAFDVFGDSVNVASRAMSTARPRTVCCTAPFRAVINALPDAGAGDDARQWGGLTTFSAAVERTAKGKGAMTVYEVTTLPSSRTER
jgi:class 3 adenylate cyclase